MGHFPLRNKEFRNHSHSDYGWTFGLNLHYHRCSLMRLCCVLPFLLSISKNCAASVECGGGQEFSMARARVSIFQFSSPQQPTLFRGCMGLWSCTVHLWWSHMPHNIRHHLPFPCEKQGQENPLLKLSTKLQYLSLTLYELLLTSFWWSHT